MDTEGAQNHEETDRQGDPLALAAYTLGRNLHWISAWRRYVQNIAGDPIRPWLCDFPIKMFCSACDEPPVALFLEVDSALCDLAIGGCVDAAMLVELHRSLDVLSRACDDMAEQVSLNRRQEVVELYSGSMHDDYLIQKLSSHVLNSRGSSVGAYRQVGDHYGFLTGYLAGTVEPPAVREEICPLLQVAKNAQPEETWQPLSAISEEIESLKTIGDAIALTPRYIDVLVAFDAQVHGLLSCDGDEEVSPVIIFDEAWQQLTFLGRIFPFDDFKAGNASGGLKVLGLLARDADVPMSAAYLCREAELERTPEGLSEYFSRLRSVLKPTIDAAVEASLRPAGREGMEKAFIVSDRRARELAKKSSGETCAWYRLDLPKNLVHYVARVRG